MTVRIYKVQMPLDLEKARATGTMWVDLTQRPRMLVYQRGGKPRQIDDEVLWDAMMNGLNTLDQPNGWVKAFWEATWDGQKLNFIRPVPMQEW